MFKSQDGGSLQAVGRLIPDNYLLLEPHKTIMAGRSEMLSLLYGAGADIDMKFKGNHFPQHCALFVVVFFVYDLLL
jgi:hypothetical protein